MERTVTHDTRHAVGAAQMCAGMLIIPFLDVFAKLLGETHGAFEITFWRFFMQSALMLPFVYYLKLWRIPPGTFGLQACRGLLLAAATAFFFAALRHIPMAEAIAIFFVQPLILTLLSVVFLGERLRFRRIAAILAGLGGTLVILQPSVIAFGLPALLPLGSALAMAFYMILTRKLSTSVHAYQMQFVGGIVSMLAVAALLGIGNLISIPGTGYTPLNSNQILWVIGLGVSATLGHAFIVWAAGNAPANLLAPFQYVEIIGAATLGYLVFGDIPASSTFVGVGIIVASGLYLLHRERQLEQRRRAPAASPTTAAGSG
ncbi:MAG: DMT family transporter [Alphaproteobacteria bacterium]|jgi:drug/metabolite transporter (DMT)-like permease